MHAAPDRRPSAGRRPLLALVVLGLVLLAGELIASTLLLYRYRTLAPDVVLPPERGFLSTAVVAHKLFERLGLETSPCRGAWEYATRAEPEGLHRPDPVLGYAPRPGRYDHLLMRRPCNGEGWQTLRVEVTINPDGSRWTGAAPRPGQRNLWAFGDSWVFGYGVHDAQSWAARVQAARPDLNVRLFALAGWGLGQSLLQVRAVKDRIEADDIVIVGYADFLDDRSVVAPSRLRFLAYYNRTRGVRDTPIVALPRFDLAADGRLELSYVDQDCARNAGYCDRPDPPRDHMHHVSAALINAVARETPARVLLLRFGDGPDNPVYRLLDPRIEIVPALTSDFASHVRDDIAGFDDHPGPYWHHAVGQRVIERLGGPADGRSPADHEPAAGPRRPQGAG